MCRLGRGHNRSPRYSLVLHMGQIWPRPKWHLPESLRRDESLMVGIGLTGWACPRPVGRGGWDR